MILLAAWTALLLAAGPAPAGGCGHLGSPFAIARATPIADLEAHPERWFNRDVRIEGIVASVCLRDGCVMEVVPAGGSRGESVLAGFADTTRFPTDCRGARVVLEGMFYRKVYPASRVVAWQEHSFRPGEPVPPFTRLLRMTVRAAEVGPRGVPVPPGRALEPAPTDRVDLLASEFEDDACGTGRKRLGPGEATPAHNSSYARELVFCLEGAITIRCGDAPPVVLGPSQMGYVPPNTWHEIRNEGRRPATYLFVFAMGR